MAWHSATDYDRFSISPTLMQPSRIWDSTCATFKRLRRSRQPPKQKLARSPRLAPLLGVGATYFCSMPRKAATLWAVRTVAVCVVEGHASECRKGGLPAYRLAELLNYIVYAIDFEERFAPLRQTSIEVSIPPLQRPHP